MVSRRRPIITTLEQPFVISIDRGETRIILDNLHNIELRTPSPFLTPEHLAYVIHQLSLCARQLALLAESGIKLRAWEDRECMWGYMIVCDLCITLQTRVPKSVDISAPLMNPPALGKMQQCELCKREGMLV